ncbi:MAG: dihydrodipicolinate synthase family protein [Acidimicrobiales bacterium]
MSATLRLGGVMPALVTPLDDSGRLDRPALHRILDHVLAASVSGISPSGSTGEGPLLDRNTRVALIAEVVAHVPPGIVVVPGAVGLTSAELAADIAAYQSAGAAAVLVAPPWYYPLDAAGVRRFYMGAADSSPLPIVLYNIPSMTKVTIPPGIVAELAEHPMLAGMKDSSRDMEYFEEVLHSTAGADFSLLTGSDTLLASSVLAGGQGTIAASVNVAPQLACEVHVAASEGRIDDAHRHQARLAALVAACRRAGTPVAWKAALALLGLCGPDPAAPLSPLGDDATAQLASDLRALGILGAPLRPGGGDLPR